MTSNPNSNYPPGMSPSDPHLDEPEIEYDDFFDDDPYHADSDERWGNRERDDDDK